MPNVRNRASPVRDLIQHPKRRVLRAGQKTGGLQRPLKYNVNARVLQPAPSDAQDCAGPIVHR